MNLRKLAYSLWTALISVEGERISERLLVICCDFFAVYFLIFESVAIPYNTMVLFGSYGIVLSSKMFNPGDSICINRRGYSGYSGYSGLEKII